MINLLLGAPGGGKSYEAVVFHILPALAKGRKVITNLPVNVDEFEKIHPGAAELIEIRTTTKAPRPPEQLETGQNTQRVTLATATPWRSIPFWHPDDFEDFWRHPDKGFGPLYVIDECHIPLPVRGTLVKVEEWFSLHRHHNADVLLITQSYGKISAAIRDLVQVVYRVRKNVALGSMGSYTRKVQDGLRGEVVNTTMRQYEPKFFPLYKSHTQSSSGAELGANDIRPFWKHWTFIGAAIFIGIFLVMLASGKIGLMPTAPKQPATKPAPTPAPPAPTPAPAPVATPTSTPQPPTPDPQPDLHRVATTAPAPDPYALPPLEPENDKPEPFSGLSLHLRGSMTMGDRTKWFFVVSANGIPITDVDEARLIAAGYKWHPVDFCFGWLDYPGVPRRPIRCDVPQVGVRLKA